jgi:Cyclin-dependent kinase inhibitor 3 (CDKN3)
MLFGDAIPCGRIRELAAIPNSYWVIPGLFLVGPHLGSREHERARAKIEILRRLDVQQIVNLCLEHECSSQGSPLVPYLAHLPNTIRLKQFPLGDGDAPSRSQMSELLDYLDECLWSGAPIYLHCRGGKCRTGMVVACFLVRHALAHGEAAIEMNERFRRFHEATSCNLKPSQIQLVLDWRRGE